MHVPATSDYCSFCMDETKRKFWSLWDKQRLSHVIHNKIVSSFGSFSCTSSCLARDAVLEILHVAEILSFIYAFLWFVLLIKQQYFHVTCNNAE